MVGLYIGTHNKFVYNLSKRFRQRKVMSFQIKNISIKKGSLLKEYYWKYMQIDRLNKELSSENPIKKIQLNFPKAPLDSPSLEITFHLQSSDIPSKTAVKWNLKKVQQCSCKQIDQPIGISKFRKVFDCVHRNLIQINPSEGTVECDEIISINVIINYILDGRNQISYFLEFDDLKIILEFNLNIVEFDPFLCILKDELFPVNIADNDPPVQAIWVFNPYFNTISMKLECVSPYIILVKSELVNLQSREISSFLVKFMPNEIKEYIVSQQNITELGKVILKYNKYQYK